MTNSLDTHMALGADGLEVLFDEIRRYLEAIEVFRREGHEPRWRCEANEKEVLR